MKKTISYTVTMAILPLVLLFSEASIAADASSVGHLKSIVKDLPCGDARKII